MSYEISYRRKLVQTLNPDFGLMVEEQGSNNCRSYNDSTGREQRARSTYVTLINFKDNLHLNELQRRVDKLVQDNPNEDILKWSPQWWLSWKSKCTTVQATLNIFKSKAYKPLDNLVDEHKIEGFLKELPDMKMFTEPETLEKAGWWWKLIDDTIFRTFKKTKRVRKEIPDEDKIYNIQINWNNLVKFTRSWYKHSYSKQYPFTEGQMKRLKKKIEDKRYKDVVIEKKS